MKIAFWENMYDTGNEIDDMVAIASMMVIKHHKKVILLDNGQKSDSLERTFRGIQRFYYVKEDSNYMIRQHGMDQILNRMHMTSDLRPLLMNSAVEVIQDHLYYVPQSKVINRLAYDYELNHEMSRIIHTYEELSDYIMIRTRSGNHLSTKHILEDADLVLVELSQDPRVLQQFFDHYASIRHKALFVFRQYKTTSLSIYKIMNQYHLKKEQIIVITEHSPLLAASLGGYLVSYIKGYYRCTRESEHYRCMRELQRATKLILRCERGDLFAPTT